MPKTIPTIGDYAYFKLNDGSIKIGEEDDDNDNE
jgi:hypothetical protein